MRDRFVFEIPRSVKSKLKRKFPCCVCNGQNDLEIHHLDKFPKNGVLRLNVVCKRCHRAITYLEIWYPLFYSRVVVPYLEKKSISINLNELLPPLTKFIKPKEGYHEKGKNSQMVDIL